MIGAGLFMNQRDQINQALTGAGRWPACWGGWSPGRWFISAELRMLGLVQFPEPQARFIGSDWLAIRLGLHQTGTELTVGNTNSTAGCSRYAGSQVHMLAL